MQVVHTFDVDASAMLYDNTDIWASNRALRALHHGFLLVDPWYQSPAYPYRLIKYCARYGLAIVDPAMDARLVSHSDSYMPALKAAEESQAQSGISQWHGLAQLLLLYSNRRQADPLGLNKTCGHSFYGHAGIPESVEFSDILDFADENHQQNLAAALIRMKHNMPNADSHQLITRSRNQHQPHVDWYAHVQQLVQGSKA